MTLQLWNRCFPYFIDSLGGLPSYEAVSGAFDIPINATIQTCTQSLFPFPRIGVSSTLFLLHSVDIETLER